MTDGRVAVAGDRLPWLSDNTKPQPEPRSRRRFGLLTALGLAILLVAGLSYWLGQRSAERPSGADIREQGAKPTTTVPLPQARSTDPLQPRVEPETLPTVAPVPTPPVTPVREVAPAARRHRTLETASPEAPKPEAKPAQATKPAAEEPAPAPAKAAPRRTEHPERPWPVRVTDGASGRLVRVGAFTTPRQAKKGWWAIVRNNPSLKRLPALVVPATSRRNGRTYYRLQMGTTSQAHSEVLCQRMRRIGQSCVVIEVFNRGQGAGA